MRSSVPRRAVAVPTALLIAAASTPAAAQNVVDQQAPNVSNYYRPLGEWVAQSFTPRAANVSGASVWVRYLGPVTPDSATFSIWTGIPSRSSLTSRQLTSTTVHFTAVQGNQGGWVDAFWSPLTVVPGQMYYLVVGGGDNSRMNVDYYSRYGYLFNDPSRDIYGRYYQENYPYSLTFRTYTSTAVTAAPEPATWSLLGTGLLAVGGLVVRRKRGAAA